MPLHPYLNYDFLNVLFSQFVIMCWRKISGGVLCLGRACMLPITILPRSRLVRVTLALIAFFLFMIIISDSPTCLQRQVEVELKQAELEVHIQFLETQYRLRQEELLRLQKRHHNTSSHVAKDALSPLASSPELAELLKNGSRTEKGFLLANLQHLRMPLAYQMLPHLMDDLGSLKPVFRMTADRELAEVVLAIPTVKRDKESYLMITLNHLIDNISDEDLNSTLIIIMVAETDIKYVVTVAKSVEAKFPKHVESGLIEVISPSSSYYPNLDKLQPTLGDSQKRAKWRTKQNLDAIYLMAYAQDRGKYYMMLEDDIIAKKNYMTEMKTHITKTLVANPKWIILEFCHIGGIGKLFRSSQLFNFVTYVQLFYTNMPIDWLIESYLSDLICSFENPAACSKHKMEIRPKYKTSLFQHIGLYSSLKGKIQKLKSPLLASMPFRSYFPHKNPPLMKAHTDIEVYSDHDLAKAYNGQTFFWGLNPKKGNVIEFWFAKPIQLQKYFFRSGNPEHITDKLYETIVEGLPVGNNGSFVFMNTFDEFGLSEGDVGKELGKLSAVRLRVNRDSNFWVILSEIVLTTAES